MRLGRTLNCGIILLSLPALAACAGGGGGSLGSMINTGTNIPAATPPPPAPSPPPPPPSSPSPLFFDTGLTGSVGVPAPASFGNSPIPAQIAPLDGSNFETANNSAFPVLSASLQAASTGLSAVSPNQGATAVVTSTGKDTYY